MQAADGRQAGRQAGGQAAEVGIHQRGGAVRGGCSGWG